MVHDCKDFFIIWIMKEKIGKQNETIAKINK